MKLKLKGGRMKIKVNRDKSIEAEIDVEKYLVSILKGISFKAKDFFKLINIFDRWKKDKKEKKKTKFVEWNFPNFDSSTKKVVIPKEVECLTKKDWLPPKDLGKHVSDDWNQVAKLDFNTFFNSHDKLTGRKHTLRANRGWGKKKFLSELAAMEPDKLIYGKIKGPKIHASKNCNFVVFIWEDQVVGCQEGSRGFVQNIRYKAKEHFIYQTRVNKTLGLRLDEKHKVEARGFITKI